MGLAWRCPSQTVVNGRPRFGYVPGLDPVFQMSWQHLNGTIKFGLRGTPDLGPVANLSSQQ